MLTALAVFLPMVSAEAVGTRQVVATDFPEIDDVAAIYPFYEGGFRQFVVEPTLIFIARDCLHERFGPTAPTGGRAMYWGADGENPSPFDEGGPEPQVKVYRFKSLARAHEVLEKIRHNVTRCYGRSAEGERVRVRRAVTVPALGSEPPLAWRTRLKNNPDREEFPETYTLDIWMRRGRFLILVDVYRTTPPGKDNAVSLAQAALDAIG